MYYRREQPNLIQNSLLDQYPSIMDKATCPICCNSYQSKYTPMISCEDHTICVICLKQIVKKAVETPEMNSPTCPICRRKVILPLRLSEEYIEFIKLLEAVAGQSQELKQKNQLLSNRDSEIKKKNIDLLEIIKEMKTVEVERDQLKTQNTSLKKKISNLREGMNILIEAISDPQQKQKLQNQPRQQIVNRPNQEVQIDNRPSLSELFHDDQIRNGKQLFLARKQFKPLQIQFLVIYDLKNIVELNLSCNRILNEGFKILIERSNFVNLVDLSVSNNLITELPTNIQLLTKLKSFNIGNFIGEQNKSCNRLKESEFYKMVDQEWNQLEFLTVEFETFDMWENEDNLNQVIHQWPNLTKLTICTLAAKRRDMMVEYKCRQMTKVLNKKYKRPGLKRVQVAVQIQH